MTHSRQESSSRLLEEPQENTDKKHPLTSAELTQLCKLLSRLEPGALSRAVFTEIARLVTTPVVEIFQFKLIGHRVHVLLTRRDANDPTWPSMYHSPGAAFRPTDTTLDLVIARIMRGELNTEDECDLAFLGLALNRTARGPELALVFMAEHHGETTVGEFHPIEELPNTTVDHHAPMIQVAARAFAEYKGLTPPQFPSSPSTLIPLPTSKPSSH